VTSAPRTADEAGQPSPEGDVPAATMPASRPARRFPVDAAIGAGLVAIAAVVTGGLLTNPVTGALALNANDQVLMEWMLALGPRLFTGDLDLVTHLLNAPDGVNLMGNTSILVLGALLAPVTATAGASVSFALAAFLNLAGTAVAFYLLFARGLRMHPAGAALGAALCAYGPGTVSQNNSHLHMTAQALLPAIVWCVLRLTRTTLHEPRRIVATGALLGVLVTVQVFVGEEPLFLTAITLAVFCVAYAVADPARAKAAAGPLGAGLAVGGVLSAIALAYPLWLQFAGPQHLPNGPFSQAYFGSDLAGFWSFSPLSLAGSAGAAKLASGAAEYNTFLGWPLLIAVAAAVGWLRRRPGVVAAAVTGVILATLSLGTQLIVDAERTDHEPPMSWFTGVPILDSALPTRFALPLLPLFGYILGLAVEKALRCDQRTLRRLVPAAIVLALLPIAPKPLPTIDRAPVPVFFTSGHWRRCVPPGGTLVPVPLPTPGNPDKMRWAAAADDAFALPEGFFIGPYAAGGKASVGTFSQSTSQLFNEVDKTGTVPEITARQQADTGDDIRFWRASCFVLAYREQTNAAQLRATVDALLGRPGEVVDDVVVWKVTPAGTP
jgi:hypothetical protein